MHSNFQECIPKSGNVLPGSYDITTVAFIIYRMLEMTNLMSMIFPPIYSSVINANNCGRGRAPLFHPNIAPHFHSKL
eukprot:c54193_g1_i1 orf=312-542(+)